MVASSNPKVIACGHRHIHTKSGNSFPAFLIRLPEHDGEKSDDRYFWRSKRDFLLLNRATDHSFPKKAFAKLSDQALSGGAWVRPNDDEGPSSGGYCKLLRDVGDIIIERNNFNPNMKKSLQHLDEFLSKAFSASRKATTDNSDENSLIVKAWAVFCKPEHTEHLADSSNNTTNNSYETHTPTAARLGQYFASDENARLVVKKMIELLERDVDPNAQLIFIEPSCGDGRILSELLNATKQIEADSINTLGYDIDPTAIERAKINLSGSKVALECKDFLSLSRQDLLSSILPPTATKEETSSRKRRRADDDRKVMVLGGPPYTPKPLPQKFILHSIQQLKAQVVVFILPERCKKDADHIQQILNSTIPDGEKRRWLYSHTELPNIDFSFEQSTVQQPSVLQCWYQM